MRKSIFSLLLFLSVPPLGAQTLEPKLYANTPIDANFLMLGYSYTQGAIPGNQSIGLENPNLKINSAVFVYGKSFDFFGRNAKFDLILPHSSLSGTAQEYGKDVTRDVEGLGDTKVRFTFNLFGAPSLTLKEFANYKQDLIVGISFQATLPTGQYDASKLINIGTNRWSIKPAIGISKTVSNYTFELVADTEIYTSNDNYYNGAKRKQDPIYSTQAHALYTFGKGMWWAMGITYYWGGEYFNDGIGTNKELKNSRIGTTLALPIDKKNSLKIYGSVGINTRYGSDFDSLVITWQHHWAD